MLALNASMSICDRLIPLLILKTDEFESYHETLWGYADRQILTEIADSNFYSSDSCRYELPDNFWEEMPLTLMPCPLKINSALHDVNI